MYSDTRKPDQRGPRPTNVSVRPDGERKHARWVHFRKVTYRVGYNWNKGGRLKELRIRHLARKFLKIWMQNTFGRILPHKAKSHHYSVVLRRAFGGWRDEWWTSRREWSLTMRAECHYRYYLYNLVFHRWQLFLLLQRQRKCKLQHAQTFADRQKMRLVWDRWEVFTEMRRMKNRMLKSALEQKRLATLHFTWSLWQTKLQQCHDLHALEERAVKQCALTLQRRAWLQWKDMQTTACSQKENESKASLHLVLRLKEKALHQWISYVSSCQTKKRSKAVAQRACFLHLVRMCWDRWNNALHHRWSEEERLQASWHLAKQSIQRRALERWRAYVILCREDAERNQMARQHHHNHLLNAGLQGLSLNVNWKKTCRLNNNEAVQHYNQTMLKKYWKLWQECLEEAEDKSFQPLTQMAQRSYSTSLLSSSFHYWRGKLFEQRHMQEMEHRADIWFAECMLPRCFNSWVEFTLQRRYLKQRRRTAEAYDRQRQYTWVFYTWWGQSEKHKTQMLSERMAILHEERCCMQRAWSRWRQRTEQQISEKEKVKASDGLYMHRLLHKTMTQWKDNSTEIRDRRSREQQACHQGDLYCKKWAVEKWKKFIHSRRVKRSQLEQMQRHHEVKLLKRTMVSWKLHHLQMCHIYAHAEELYKCQTQRFLRRVLSVWRENAVLLAESQFKERQAHNHFQHFLKLKTFLAWREAAERAVSVRHQQEEAVAKAQRSINQVRLLQYFRQWRKQTREARRERICMEKAKQHHNSQILSKALKAWNKHHYLYRKYKVMKRQGLLLLRLKMYQTYFEQWKMKLQQSRREAKQTERALWHWSLTLQAKVLCGWRLWVTEQRRKQDQAARAAQVYRDQLLKEGVTCILTYAAHMNDLTTSLTQHSQEQRSHSHHRQRVVKRCAMRWKQRALCKSQKGHKVQGGPLKKSVTFCPTTPASSSDSAERETEDGVLIKLIPPRTPRRQPRRCEELFESPQTVLSPRNPIQTQDLLLPPSAFMTTGTKVKSGKAFSSSHGEAPSVPPLKHHSSVYPEMHPRASDEETKVPVEDAAVDPALDLTRELLDIQIDMKSFQKDKKQLSAWKKLKEVLESWVQTSGKEEQMEKNEICRELEELEERIHKLSTKLAKEKPTMLLHAERIRHLQTVLQTSGVSLLLRQTEEMETALSAFTT